MSHTGLPDPVRWVRPSIIYHPSSIIYHPSSIIHHPSSIIHHPSLIIDRPSLIVDRLGVSPGSVAIRYTYLHPVFSQSMN